MSSPITRRQALQRSALGLAFISAPGLAMAAGSRSVHPISGGSTKDALPSRYPSIDDALVSEIVGKSHFDLERVKEIVGERQEMARATWDWGFGDWESAIGAASHVGRRDIVAFLMDNGARPNIYTLAMLGHYKAVRAMIEAEPAIASIPGPHGISLLRHAVTGARNKDLSSKQRKDHQKLRAYLDKAGTADPRQPHIEMTDTEMERYLGDYRYGPGESEGFSVRLNMLNMLCLGRLGAFGGGLFQESPNVFAYNGIQSVRIEFHEGEGVIESLTVREPNLELTATRI